MLGRREGLEPLAEGAQPGGVIVDAFDRVARFLHPADERVERYAVVQVPVRDVVGRVSLARRE